MPECLNCAFRRRRRRSSFVVRRSSFGRSVVRRSSFVVRRSPFVVRRSSFVVVVGDGDGGGGRGRTLIVQRSCVVVLLAFHLLCTTFFDTSGGGIEGTPCGGREVTMTSLHSLVCGLVNSCESRCHDDVLHGLSRAAPLARPLSLVSPRAGHRAWHGAGPAWY